MTPASDGPPDTGTGPGVVAVDPSLARPGTGAPAPTGILGEIAKRRDAIRATQQRDVTIPRWSNPELHVVFAPIEHDILRRAASIQERAGKDKSPKRQAQVELETNADLLVNACLEIYAVLPDGTKAGLGPNGERTRFDRDLAIALGLPEDIGARSLCLPPTGIFITDADLLSTAQEIAAWSGYREDAVDSALAGES